VKESWHVQRTLSRVYSNPHSRLNSMGATDGRMHFTWGRERWSALGNIIQSTNGLSTRCQPPQIFTTEIMFNNFHYKLWLVWIFLCSIPSPPVSVQFIFPEEWDVSTRNRTIKSSWLKSVSTNVAMDGWNGHKSLHFISLSLSFS